jgi:hypothetical protein
VSADENRLDALRRADHLACQDVWPITDSLEDVRGRANIVIALADHFDELGLANLAHRTRAVADDALYLANRVLGSSETKDEQ